MKKVLLFTLMLTLMLLTSYGTNSTSISNQIDDIALSPLPAEEPQNKVSQVNPDPNAFTFEKAFPDPTFAEIIAENFGKETWESTSIEELAGYEGTLVIGPQYLDDDYDKSTTTTTKDLVGISYLKGLTGLDCYKNDVTELPAEISELKNLKAINMTKAYGLTTIPPEIGELENLEELSFSLTSLEKLPGEIGNLKNLRILLLDNTLISFLPDEIGNLKNLESLDIHSTNITSVPDSVCELKNLKYLNMGHLELGKLPEKIGDLKNLETLYLFGCSLKTLPRSMANMTNLQNINLYNNFELSESYKAFLPARLWKGKNF